MVDDSSNVKSLHIICLGCTRSSCVTPRPCATTAPIFCLTFLQWKLLLHAWCELCHLSCFEAIGGASCSCPYCTIVLMHCHLSHLPQLCCLSLQPAPPRPHPHPLMWTCACGGACACGASSRGGVRGESHPLSHACKHDHAPACASMTGVHVPVKHTIDGGAL